MRGTEFLTGLYDSFGRGDITTVLGSMDPEVHWHEAEGSPYMPSGEAWVGPDAVMNNLFAKLGADWDEFTIHPETFHEAGDVVVVEARYTATHKGTGKSLDAQVCHVWTLKDGKVIKFQQYVDTAKLQEVMGVHVA